jgi:hypothetical protein
MNASRKSLAIGMATYDDYDGVYFTVITSPAPP